MWFAIKNVREKIRRLPEALSLAEGTTNAIREGLVLGRDATVCYPSELPPKPGLSMPEGHARLLHDLANIELQAMELAVRSLYEFPEAPAEFKKDLSEIALGEARHLGLCLDALDDLNRPWGTWGVHTSLWSAVGPEDTLLDRLAIVHRYLEGSGLDSGERIMRRLSGVQDLGLRRVMTVITTEEVDHVLFGSRWFQKVCEEQKLDSEQEFIQRLEKIFRLIPRREKVARDLRVRAGFTPLEIDALEKVQTTQLGSFASSMGKRESAVFPV